jgi:hypothetical protein
LVLSAMAQQEPEQEPEQIDLEDLLGLPRPIVAPDGAPERRGPGRPPGSRNRRTVQWVDFLLRRYASPLEVLAQMATARVDDLKNQLGCNALEAFQEKRHAAIALAPFLHQRQPLALNVTERKVVYLTISTDKPDATLTDAESITLAAEIVKPEPDSDTETQGHDDTSA